jgi:hypothetical protein
MRTTVDPTETESVGTAVLGDGVPTTITTTLYDLMAAIQDAAAPHNDALAVATLWYMLHSGRATWRGNVVACVN